MMTRMDVERAVLGAMLLSTLAGDPQVDPIALGLAPEHFRSEQNRELWEAIVETYWERGATNPIVVGEWLSRNGRLRAAGGHERLLDLLEGVVDASGIGDHAAALRGDW